MLYEVITIYVNKAFELTTGYSRAEVIGKNPRILQTTGTDKKVYARFVITSYSIHYTKLYE